MADDFRCTEDEYRALIQQVHERTVPNLKEVLAASDRFDKFKNRLGLGTGEDRARRTLERRITHQAWRFPERPVFAQEPFSLQEIYVEVACVTLTSDEVTKAKSLEKGPHRKALDPFVKKHGGRQPLLHTVLGPLGNDKLRDAIVIQGVAGEGKSTFTLRLCADFETRGSGRSRAAPRPKAGSPHPRCLGPGDSVLRPRAGRRPAPDLAGLDADSLLPELLANDSVMFRDTRSADPCSSRRLGRVERERLRRPPRSCRTTLSQIRSEFLDRPRGSVPIRVILTGRPSTSVEESEFLRNGTPILTMRPLKPQDLRTLVGKLTRVFVRPSDLFPEGHKPIDPEMFDPVYATYDGVSAVGRVGPYSLGDRAAQGAGPSAAGPSSGPPRCLRRGQARALIRIPRPCPHAGGLDGRVPGAGRGQRDRGRPAQSRPGVPPTTLVHCNGDHRLRQGERLATELESQHPDLDRRWRYNGPFPDLATGSTRRPGRTG